MGFLESQGPRWFSLGTEGQVLGQNVELEVSGWEQKVSISP